MVPGCNMVFLKLLSLIKFLICVVLWASLKALNLKFLKYLNELGHFLEGKKFLRLNSDQVLCSEIVPLVAAII